MSYKTINTTAIAIISILFLTVGSYPAYGLDTNDQSDLHTIDPQDVKITLNFQDAYVSDILDYLSEKSGLVIIADSYPSGRVSLVSKQPLNLSEVISLINTVLKDKGYSAIRTGRTLKLVSVGEAKYLNIPVTTGNDPDKIPETDDIVTHIIPIRYADAEKLQEDIEPLISEDTIMSSNEASNSLIITDTNTNIKRIVRIVKSVDTQMSSVTDVKVFLLEYADAESTADLINNVFEQQTSDDSSNQNPFMRMMGRRGGPGGGPGQQNSSSTTTGSASNVPVIADSDDRTNAVVVSGPADVLEVIALVVEELDSNPDEERSLFVYKLKYANAENIKETLNSLFQELEDINDDNSNNTGGGAPGRNFGGPGGGTSSDSSSSSSDVSDEVYIEADEDTNSLIIMTSSKNYDKIKEVLDQLDVPIPQVLIKVLIAELTISDETDIGVEWEFLVDEQGTADKVSNAFSPGSSTDGLVSHIISGDLDATLSALQTNNKLNILSRPYITTSNNQSASINVGQDYPYITNSVTSDEGGVTNTIEYETIGITLEVTPNVNVDNLVIMDVNPSIIEATTSTVEISTDLEATVFDTRSADCTVAVPNGQTVVIGGLMKNKEEEIVTKIPLLGDIPIIGEAFKRTETDQEKIELLIFLTPQVAENAADLKRISDHERSKSKYLKKNDDEVLQEHIENMESVYKE